MNVTPRQLRIFLTLSETLSFRETADRFFVTQPALSKAVKDLEEELGLSLFERSTRRVRLSRVGQRLIPLARRTLGEFDLGLQHMQDMTELESQQLAMASLPSLACALLPHVCADVERRFQGARITVFDGTMESTLKRVQEYEVDFALTYASPLHPNLHYEEILRDRFVLLAAGPMKRHIRPDMYLADLIRLPLISMTNASTAMKFVSAAYLQQGIQFQPKYQFDQVGTIASYVRKGLGVALLPYLGVTPLLSLKGLIIAGLKDAPIRSVGVVTRTPGTHSAIADYAIESARANAGKLVSATPAWVLPPAGR